MTTAGLTLEQARARIRDEAAEQMDGWYSWLDELDAAHISGVPRARKHRRMSGAADWTRGDGGEHDELMQLPAVEIQRLRDNDWIRHDGRNDADDVLDRLEDRGYSDPWDEWLRVTRIVDACRAVKAGRAPGAWARETSFPWWTVVAPGCEADGMDIRDLIDTGRLAPRMPTKAERAARRITTTGTDAPATVTIETKQVDPATVDAQLAAYLERLVHAPKREYAAAFAAHLTTGTDAPARPATGWVDKCEAKVRYYCTKGQGQ